MDEFQTRFEENSNSPRTHSKTTKTDAKKLIICNWRSFIVSIPSDYMNDLGAKSYTAWQWISYSLAKLMRLLILEHLRWTKNRCSMTQNILCVATKAVKINCENIDSTFNFMKCIYWYWRPSNNSDNSGMAHFHLLIYCSSVSPCLVIFSHVCLLDVCWELSNVRIIWY